MTRACWYALWIGTLSLSAGCGSDDAASASPAGGTSGAGGSATSGGVGGSSAGTSQTSGGSNSGGGSAGSAAGSAGSAGASGGGISTGYPGDVGIENDPAVIFADDFESYTDGSDLDAKWDNFYQVSGIRIATETDYVYAGQQALEFTVPEQEDELSNSVDKFVSPELDVLYLRYYSRFLSPYNVEGSSHNGASISAHYFNGFDATPGIPADGMNKFLVNLEHWRGEEATPSPGHLNVYVYHPLQRDIYGDHFFPTGLVMPDTSMPFDFGLDFVAREDVIPELDRWYCYEYMVKANTPGALDGRITFWVDGVLTADFPNLNFREIASLTIDRFGLSFHIGSNPNGETKKWYDNVVAATSYIGPMAPP